MSEHHHNEQPHGCSIEHFENTELVVRADILSKAQELAELISTSEEVQQYQRAESQISHNERIQKLISSIKKKQKEIVAFQTFKNEKMIDKIESEITELQNELDAIPVVTEFQQSQSDLNYLLQLIFTAVRDTVSQKINVEDGEAAAPSTCSE